MTEDLTTSSAVFPAHNHTNSRDSALYTAAQIDSPIAMATATPANDFSGVFETGKLYLIYKTSAQA